MAKALDAHDSNTMVIEISSAAFLVVNLDIFIDGYFLTPVCSNEILSMQSNGEYISCESLGQVT